MVCLTNLIAVQHHDTIRIQDIRILLLLSSDKQDIVRAWRPPISPPHVVSDEPDFARGGHHPLWRYGPLEDVRAFFHGESYCSLSNSAPLDGLILST